MLTVDEVAVFSAHDIRGLTVALAANGLQLSGSIGAGRIIAEAPSVFPSSKLLGTMRLGAYSFVTGPTELRDTVIGRFCSIAPGVVSGLNEHPTQFLTSHPIGYGRGSAFAKDEYFHAVRQAHNFTEPGRTTIGNDVWIGEGAFIRRGVNIGDGAVIAARTVVVRDVLPYQIVAGVPARVVRPRFGAHVVERLLASKWWQLDLRTIRNFDFSDIETAAEILLSDHESAARLERPRFVLQYERGNNSFTLTRQL